MVIAYKTEKINTPNKLVIDFGPKFFKSSVLINKTSNKVLTFPNSLYFISSTKVKRIESDFKDAINNLQSGVFTKQEIESAQLLLQADERFIDISNEIHIEKAYQNFFEQISEQNPFDFRDDTINFENWSVYLTIPYVKDYEVVLKHHLDYLKSIGFIFIKPIDHLTSSFYSQISILGQENIKHKFGIIVNVSEFTDIGVFDEHLIADGTSQIPLGTSTVVEYGLAFLRDLAIRGFKRELLEEWIYEGGTCFNDSPSIMKNIRRKTIDIKALLNAPRIMFDYHSVTNMNLEVNSIQDGIVNLLNKKNKKIKKNINKIISNIIVVGPGAVYKGFGDVLKSNLANNFKADINVITGVDPRNSEFNGLLEYLNLYEEYDVYNVTKIKLEDKQRKALEKQFSSQVKLLMTS